MPKPGIVETWKRVYSTGLSVEPIRVQYRLLYLHFLPPSEGRSHRIVVREVFARKPSIVMFFMPVVAVCPVTGLGKSQVCRGHEGQLDKGND